MSILSGELTKKKVEAEKYRRGLAMEEYGVSFCLET
jgi:hypothetical protein